MNNKEKCRLKSLLGTKAEPNTGARRKSTSNNGRSLTLQENSNARKRDAEHHQQKSDLVPKDLQSKKAVLDIKVSHSNLRCGELKDISNSPSLFRSPKSKQELSSCKSINFEKMLFRNNDNIYKDWTENQNQSKWEQLASSPKSENFFKIVYGTSNLETTSKPKTPVLDKTNRNRDFSSQIDNLPGPRALSGMRIPPKPPTDQRLNYRKDMESQIFSTENRARRPPSANYFAGMPQCATATFNLASGGQNARPLSRKRNEAMSNFLYSTPKDYLGSCK